MRGAALLAARLICGSAAGILVAGCAEAGFLAQLGKSATGSAARDTGQGGFVVGEPYQAAGVWHAPREDYALDETGLGVVVAVRAGARTANGEAADPNKLTAQHPTLQLPAIVRVTNLENGRSVLLRVNDRGPAEPGRLIGLSPQGGRLLGFPARGAAQVRVQVVGAESRQVAAEARARTPIPASQQIAIAPAPRPAVQAEALPPPPGARVATSPRSAAPLPAPPPTSAVQLASLPTERLPDTLTQSYAAPGTLWVQAGAFGNAQNAERMRARLSGVGPSRAVPLTSGGRTLWRVRVGPAASVGDADRLLAAAIRAGANEARIIVD
ncbi:septal ring lytic transglycosylase RlpA family protein [Elioraea sp.]|uniref:septal ring lytic transglycosylase RlpA family protein n=1 Tax=Elioraea sp. TaxID=2185103 RepID=UPI0025BB6012|nr:SPOR domain-containing protein [Elioraea sp.]